MNPLTELWNHNHKRAALMPMMVGMEMRMGVMAFKAHGKFSRVLYVIPALPVKRDAHRTGNQFEIRDLKSACSGVLGQIFRLLNLTNPKGESPQATNTKI